MPFSDPRFYYDTPPFAGKWHISTGSQWFTCDRCGFDYPIKYRIRQQGLQVCTYLPCFDTIVPSFNDDNLLDLEESTIDLEAIEDAK